MKNLKLRHFFILFVAFMLMCSSPIAAKADKAANIDRDVTVALERLYTSTPSAKELSKIAEAILVFPSVIKGGFIIGGQYGEGALRDKDGKTLGYYSTAAASYGLQAGAQSFGYAMFFMTSSTLEYLQKSTGWEFGVGPSVVIVNEGLARTLTTTTAKEGIYAYFFSQKGLMAGLGLQGSTITQIRPDK